MIPTNWKKFWHVCFHSLPCVFPSDMCSDIWHSIWHLFWHSILHFIWQSMSPYVWPSFRLELKNCFDNFVDMLLDTCSGISFGTYDIQTFNICWHFISIFSNNSSVPKIHSDIRSDILSDKFSDIVTGMCFRVLSDIFFAFLSGILSETYLPVYQAFYLTCTLTFEWDSV